MDFESYRKLQYPIVGLPAAELAAALTILPAGSRIIRLDTRHDGWLFVETGRFSGMRAGSGQHFLLERTDAGWVIAESRQWKA